MYLKLEMVYSLTWVWVTITFTQSDRVSINCRHFSALENIDTIWRGGSRDYIQSQPAVRVGLQVGPQRHPVVPLARAQQTANIVPCTALSAGSIRQTPTKRLGFPNFTYYMYCNFL